MPSARGARVLLRGAAGGVMAARRAGRCRRASASPWRMGPHPCPAPCTHPAPTQVRHYYYRLIKRLNKVLGEGRVLDSRNALAVHRAMLKFWDVVSGWRACLPAREVGSGAAAHRMDGCFAGS